MIDEPYSWGLYIVEHMYEEYGQVKVINLIKSTAPTFVDALTKELGVSPSEFEQGWKTHLADRFGSPITSVESVLPSGVPEGYLLAQNYPNPFNPETTISYDIAKTGTVRVSVYALTGQLVRTLVDGERPAGSYSVTWDGKDDAGRDVASGVYLCRMVAGEYSAVRKLMLVR